MFYPILKARYHMVVLPYVFIYAHNLFHKNDMESERGYLRLKFDVSLWEHRL